ncbi:V-type ATP synthase subunit D [Youxingia wuxianensis]|uniref:V-type ATP synthase subunit D n=1 Tax=Youxingia wuxianensis TaxID=2763678 RepID=A0A926IGC7_9FIRM|nr:V-type ATP synthase subunit D [Youxingia wuxianensis]MBC8584101.1 V-type ATP synthase subunit D [Youxingia wuxianensis]
MNNTIFPTKGNLINTKKSLKLARLGFDLMDRKRNILIREMMSLIDQANQLRDKVDKTFSEAYMALQKANITLGVCEKIAKMIPEEETVEITYRSVMGVEIPSVTQQDSKVGAYYGFWGTNSQMDQAYLSFHKVKLMMAQLAEIENSVYRLAVAVKKTQGRANALKNIIIPQFEYTVKYIADALEEKEREEFSRLKVIKANKSNGKTA